MFNRVMFMWNTFRIFEVIIDAKNLSLFSIDIEIKIILN
jgi:hypothetical protein